MFRRSLIAGLVVLLMGHLSPSALADHNCCLVSDWCASSSGMTLEACTDAGGILFPLNECLSTGTCTDPKFGNPAPICSDNAPHDECRTLIEAGVPTVSEWGLATLLLLIVSAATVMLLKRRNRVAA